MASHRDQICIPLPCDGTAPRFTHAEAVRAGRVRRRVFRGGAPRTREPMEDGSLSRRRGGVLCGSHCCGGRLPSLTVLRGQAGI
jgi:hypothetical protein